MSREKSKGLTADELWTWQQSMNACINQQELKVLFDSNKAVVNSEPQVYEMFQARKKQLA